jgi:hypothetical protein
MTMHVRLPAPIYQERAFQVADHVSGLSAVRFNLARWCDEHGFPSCLAGHATWLALFGKDISEMRLAELEKARERFAFVHVGEYASEWLGLSGEEASLLFIPSKRALTGDNMPISNAAARADELRGGEEARLHVSSKWAANTLRGYGNTGIVDWKSHRPGTRLAIPSFKRLLELV